MSIYFLVAIKYNYADNELHILLPFKPTFFFLNELGNIIPIRNLIIDVDNIVTYFINLFAVLKVSFESCIFSLVNKLFHFSIVLHSRLSVKGQICFYTIRKYSFCSMVFSEIFSSKNTIRAII